MSNEENLDLISRIRQEGLHYAFIHYSDFSEIKDEKFHKLRKEYIEIVKKLSKYIKYNCD